VTEGITQRWAERCRDEGLPKHVPGPEGDYRQDHEQRTCEADEIPISFSFHKEKSGASYQSLLGMLALMITACNLLWCGVVPLTAQFADVIGGEVSPIRRLKDEPRMKTRRVAGGIWVFVSRHSSERS